jgi:hypothetical protein
MPQITVNAMMLGFNGYRRLRDSCHVAVMLPPDMHPTCRQV